MKKQPMIFRFLAFFVILVTLGMPLQIILLYDHEPDDLMSAFSNLSMVNLVFILSGAIASIHLFSISRNLRYVLPIYLAVGLLNNLYVGLVGTDFSLFETSLASIGLIAPFFVLARGKYLQLIKSQERHWWKTPARYQHSLPVSAFVGKDNMNFESFDISRSGVFLQTNDIERLEKSLATVSASAQKIYLNIKIDADRKIKCEGVIRRKVNVPSEKYPKGIGVQFINLTKSQIRAIHSLEQNQVL